MVDPLTINKFLAQPVHGSDLDIWAPPLNANYTIIDNSFGGIATVAVTSSPVTILSSQYQCVFLRFTGALNANVEVTLPAVGSFYSVINDTTNSSTFYLTLKTSAPSGRLIGIPPMTTTDIMTDATNVRFRSLPPVGSYWNYSGSSTPAWISACTVPPWLYCDGTGFSSASYPTLSVILGGATLPDFRGRQAVYYNDGTARLTSSQSGVDGNTVRSAGGSQTITLSSMNLPNVAFPVTDPGHSHTNTNNINSNNATTAGGPATGGYLNTATITINSAVTGISVNSGGSGTPKAIMPPAIVAGITLIRAA